jgi:heptosyltransferase II
MSEIPTQRIVVRCPNWVGDLVMCTPALRSLRQHFTSAHISVMVKPSLRPVIEHLPFVDEIIEYEPKGRDRGVINYVAFIRKLRSQRFDLGILMPHSFSSALVFFLAALPERIGYNRNARGWMLTRKVAPFTEQGKIVPVNMVRLYLELVKNIGCSVEDSRVELKTSASAEQWVDSFFSEHGIASKDITIVMIPGATFGSSKCWKDSSFAEVADALMSEYRARVFIVPGPGEADIAQSIRNKMKQPPVDMGHGILPLDRLMALIRRSSLLITNDTGPRHFGVAFNKPIIVLMGPTDPRYTDYGLDKTVILHGEADCAPCHLKTCPIDHRCMTMITPQKVLTAAREMIKKYKLIGQCL